MKERQDEYYHGALAVCDRCGGQRQKVADQEPPDLGGFNCAGEYRMPSKIIEVKCRICNHAWMIPERLPVDHGSKRSGAYEWPEEGKERSAACQIQEGKEG